MFLLINTGWLDEVMWVVQAAFWLNFAIHNRLHGDSVVHDIRRGCIENKNSSTQLRDALEQLRAAWPQSAKEMRKLKQKVG